MLSKWLSCIAKVAINLCSRISLCFFLPRARKVPHTYQFSGHMIQDDYFWLRDDNKPNIAKQEVLQYLTQENNYANIAIFAAHRETKHHILEQLKTKTKFTDVTAYTKKDDFYYYTRIEEGKDYKIHCRKQGVNAQEEVILDENIIVAGKQFMNIGAIGVSDDHKLLAYAVDFIGNEEFTIKIVDLATKQHLEDEIPHVHYANLSDAIASIPWHKNNTGFFYTPSSARLFPEKVMFHKLGDDYKDDKLIYFERDNKFCPIVLRSQNNRFLLINTYAGSYNKIYLTVYNILGEANEIYYLDLERDSFEPVLVRARQDKILYSIEFNNNYCFLRINDQGNNFRLIKTDINKLEERDWHTVIPVNKEKYLESFDITQNYLVLNYKYRSLPFIEIIDLRTNKKNEVIFPEAVYMATGYVTNFEEDEIRIYYSSLREPDVIYRHNFADNALQILKQDAPTEYVVDDYKVERLWANNKGEKIPISVFYKKALFKQDGSNPLYLHGYGAYGSGVHVNFRAEIIPLVDNGFIYAIAHVRGGDELGSDWYLAGKLLNKKNTFIDFIACSKHLISQNYTRENNIIIHGRSAGGLLIGAVINECPELYKAAIMHEPFVDVLNTMVDELVPLTTIEYQEWGDPRKNEYFNYIKSYSPYDNIKKQKYPSIYITTSISDPRVSYWEPAKFVAKLRAYKIDRNKLIFKIKTDAGHIGVSGKLAKLQELTDDYVYIYDTFNMLPKRIT